jgi:hypothetical protein
VNNAGTRGIHVRQHLKAGAFARGFRDVRKGRKFDADLYVGHPQNQWLYERGRQFALVYSGDLKNGQRVLEAACRAFMDAYLRKDIR